VKPSIDIRTEWGKRGAGNEKDMPAFLFPRRVLVSGIVSWLPDHLPCSAFSPLLLEGNGLWVSSPLGCVLAPCCRDPRLQWRDRCGITPHSVFLKTGSSGVWYHGRRAMSIAATVLRGICGHGTPWHLRPRYSVTFAQFAAGPGLHRLTASSQLLTRKRRTW